MPISDIESEMMEGEGNRQMASNLVLRFFIECLKNPDNPERGNGASDYLWVEFQIDQFIQSLSGKVPRPPCHV